MSIIRNFQEAQEYLRPLYQVYTTDSRFPAYTLDRIQALLEYLGNPQNQLKVIHIAGTSGKTSTVYYISALLEQTGATVGLTVSPHTLEMNERVQINHTPLPETEFCHLLTEFSGLVEQSGVTPSYFEVLVALAYWEFARRRVDYAVIEVGLGGLLDGTNVVTREDKVCVITDIGFDHMAVLGNTLRAIATQKAGVIHSKNQVFMYEQSDEVMMAVQESVGKQHARLNVIKSSSILPTDGHLPLFQQRNFYLAQQAVSYVLQRDKRPTLTEGQLQSAGDVYIPGRMEVIKQSGKTIILDGAHNEQKMAALLESIERLYPQQAIAVVVACVQARDTRWQHALDVLLLKVKHTTFSSFDHGYDDMPKVSVAPTELSSYAKKQAYTSFGIEADLQQAIEDLLQRPEPILLITGSLYMIKDARNALEQHK